MLGRQSITHTFVQGQTGKTTNMNKIIKTFGLLILILVGQVALGQRQEKIYYDKEWKGCSQSKAVFYRIVNYDANGKPVGKVMDYFITGELQSDIEGAIYIDKNDDQNSKLFGKSIGYYKSGKKNFEHIQDKEGNEISNTHWFENGNLKFERTFKNGKLDGIYSTYHENGKLKFRAEYKDGQATSKWSLDCDEFGKCQKVFFDGFATTDNFNEWPLLDKDNCESRIIEDKGLRMETTSERGFIQLIHVPIDVEENFSIETIINHESGEENSGEGLIYGFKDWDNYFYFTISANGYFKIGAVTEGLNLEFVKWQKSSHINQNTDRNQIKINKVNDKVYFSINGQIVGNEDFYAFRGNKLGFQILSGRKRVLFERILVRQDTEGGDMISKFSSSTWKGNGTGFMIDAKGYIVTNYHVVEDATEIEVDLIQNGQKNSYKAKIISSDKQNDLAVIKIDDPKFKPYPKLPYNFKTQISDVGTNVFALGYPMANLMGDEIKFTDGKISSKTGFQGDITTYQVSVPVQPGNSGGPLFDYDGNVVGVVNAKIMKADNVSYAIKTSYAKNLIDVLPETLVLPTDNSLAAKPLTEKIKTLSDYVVLIKIR
jgi:S1-C subfamily serine protease